MTRRDGLERIRREAHHELHRDGLTEIAAGVFLFIVALAAGRPAFYWTYLVGLVVLGPGLRRLRSRYTYPRIGFAELPSEDRRRLGRGMAIWVVGAFLVVAAGLALLGAFTDHLAWRRIEGAYANLRVWALVMALLCLAVGGLAFRRFLRETPISSEWSPDAE